MLCHVVAIKNLPVHHHSAGYILVPSWSLRPSWLFWKSNTAKACAIMGRMLPRKLQCCIIMKRLNQTESPIFVILCVLCFQRQSFLTFTPLNWLYIPYMQRYLVLYSCLSKCTLLNQTYICNQGGLTECRLRKWSWTGLTIVSFNP